jgi:WD40 repeat protein
MSQSAVEIFISYAHEDETLRNKLAKHLKSLQREGLITTWHHRDISAGEEWKNEIDIHLESANIILLLISSDFLDSDYCCDIELKRALERHERKEARVIPIILRAVDWHRSSFGRLNALPLEGKAITSWSNEDEAFTEIVRELRKALEELHNNLSDLPQVATQSAILLPTKIQNLDSIECPYQGLEAFTVDTAKYFFGRTSEVKEITDNLNDYNFIFISGSSGVGKTSFVQACLVPRLIKENWIILKSIKPGTDPVATLRSSFENYFRDCQEITRFEKWYDGLTCAIKNSEKIDFFIDDLPKRGKILLVVDQFEEVFTVCSNQEKRSFFLDCICHFTTTSSRLFVVVNMRTDFKSILHHYPTINRLYKERKIGLYFLDRLQGENLREAIIGPTTNKIYKFEEGLPDIILSDVDNENCLPLLQFTLKQLWRQCSENNRGNLISVKHYKDIGGLKGSLNIRADEIYGELKTDLHREMAEYLFLRLVQTNESVESSEIIKDTRRRRLEAEIIAVGGIEEREVILDVLNRFVNERLLVREGKFVDLAHETLMDSWHKFKEWRTEDRDLRRIIERIQKDFKEWESNEKRSQFLLSAALITQVEAIMLIDEQKNKVEKEFRHGSGLKDFYDISFLNYKKIQLAQTNDLEREAIETQENIQSSKPLSGLIQTLLLVNKCLKHQPLSSDLPGSVQSSLCLAMEIAREKNCFTGHTGKVKCVAISHSGQWIVSGSEDKTLRLWDLDGNCFAVFKGHTATVWSVAFSPDDSWIVSGSADNTIRRWQIDLKTTRFQSIANGKQIGQAFVGHDDWIRSVLISPDGNLIISGSKDRTICVWDLEGNQTAQFPKEHSNWIFSIAMWQDSEEPSNSFIVSGSEDNTIRLWDLNGNCKQVFEGHEGWVRCITIANKGKLIISGSEDNTIRLWGLDGKCKKIFDGHENRVLSIAVWQDYNLSNSDNTGFIASSSADRTIRLWNFNGDSIGQPLRGHTDWVREIKISSDGSFIASASKDKTVQTWDLKEGNLIGKNFGNQNKRILSVAFSPMGDLIVSGGEDKKIYLWNLDGTLNKKFDQEHGDWIRSVRMTPDNRYIVSGSADKKLHLWKVDGTFVEAKEDGHNSWIRSIAISAKGDYVVSSSNDRTLCLWKVNKLESSTSGLCELSIEKQLCFLQGHRKEVLSVTFSPDGQLIASGSADRTIRIWDLKGNVKTEFSAHEDRVMSVAFSPDGRYIVSASYDDSICLWDINGNEIWRKKFDNKVRSISFSPIENFPLIVSGSRDGTIQFWSLQGSKIGVSLKGHQDVVRSVKFSPDGESIVSASEDGTLRLWKAGNWKGWLKICCSRISSHPAIRDPNSESAREALEICQRSLNDRI